MGTVENMDDGFLAEINKGGDNFAAMLIYADWLEEQGRDRECEAWRYLGNNKKQPAKWGQAFVKAFVAWKSKSPIPHDMPPASGLYVC